MRKRLKYKIIGLSVIAIIILIFVSLQFTGMVSIDNVNDTIENAKYFGPILYILILIVHGIVSIFPAAAIVLFGGKYFGITNGFLYTMAGMTIGASAAFFIAKKYGTDIEKQWISKKKIDYLKRMFKKWGIRIVFFGRMIPVIPSDAVSFAAGTSDIKFRKFLPVTIIGLIPVTLLLIYFGTKITLDIKLITGITLLLIAIMIFQKNHHKIALMIEKKFEL